MAVGTEQALTVHEGFSEGRAWGSGKDPMNVRRIVDPSFDVNLYVVRAPEALLVDSGTGRRSPDVLRRVEEALDGTPLRRLVLTHRHVDHVGGAADLSKAHDVRPEASVDDLPALVEADPVSTGADLFGLELEPLSVVPLDYGARLDLGDATLEVLHTPGHTVGSVCLLGDEGSLFSGDTVFAYGGVGRWDLPTGDRRQLRASLRALEARGPEWLYPGHGPAVDDAAQHVALALDTLEAATG